MKEIQVPLPGSQGPPRSLPTSQTSRTPPSLLPIPLTSQAYFLLGDFILLVSLSRIFFSLIFLWLVLSRLLGLSLNCTLQHIPFISGLDYYNHLPAALRASQSPMPIPPPCLADLSLVGSASPGLAPARPSSLIFTGLLASHIILPSSAYCGMFRSLFTCHSPVWYFLPPFYGITSAPLRHNLGRCDLLRNYLSDSLLT